VFIAGFAVRDFQHHMETSVSRSPSFRGTKYKLSSAPPITFTLARASSEPLPYIENSESINSTDAILNSYDAVIEPNQAMNLFFHDIDSKKNNYLFRVCPSDVDDVPCQEGYSLSKKNSLEQKPVQFDCTPYSTFNIILQQLDDNNKVVYTQSASAICLSVQHYFREVIVPSRFAIVHGQS
jgi:hypothetical protein